MSQQHSPETFVATIPFDRLAEIYNRLGADLHNPRPGDLDWQTFVVIRQEFQDRLAAHYVTVSDRELVGVLNMSMLEPWAKKTRTAQAVVDVVERELRTRFASAAAASDAFVEAVDRVAPDFDEYAFLRVLIAESGVRG